MELHLGVDVTAGYLRVGGELHPLPIGSHLDPQTGIFTWAPGAGFVRDYDLVFVASSHGQATARREVRIVRVMALARTGSRKARAATVDCGRAAARGPSRGTRRGCRRHDRR